MRVLLRRTFLHLLLFLLLTSCVIEISDLSDEELARLVNLHVVSVGNRTVTLGFNTNPRLSLDLLRSRSLLGMQAQMLDTATAMSLQENVVCLSNDATSQYLDQGATSTCVPINAPDALANDTTYYYVIRASRTDNGAVQKVFYSNLVAATPRPDKAPNQQPLNGGIPSNRVGGLYGQEVVLIFEQLTMSPADGLQEYEIFNSSISRDNGCDYAQNRTCSQAVGTNTVQIPRIALDQYQIGSTPYTFNLLTDAVLDERDRLAQAAPIDLRLPLYYQIGITNSLATSYSNELEVERFAIDATTPAVGKQVEISLATTSATATVSATVPVLNSWSATTGATGFVALSATPLSPINYRVFYGETLSAIDANEKSFDASVAPTFLISGLKNGVGYWFKVVSDYQDTSREANRDISRISVIVAATPSTLPETPQIAVGYTNYTEAFFDASSSTSDATAIIGWLPTLSGALAENISTTYTLYRTTSPTATITIDSTVTSNAGTEVYSVTKLATPVTTFELAAASYAGTVISEPATISRFLLNTVTSSAQVAVSWVAQLTLNTSPAHPARDSVYDVYVTSEAASGTIDATTSRVANDLTVLNYRVTQLGSGTLLTNGETYVIKVVGKRDLNQDGVLEYAVSELVQVSPLPLPAIRTLSVYFTSPLETSNVAVVVATPQTIIDDTYKLYNTAVALNVSSCNLYRPPTPANCAGIGLNESSYTSPGTVDIGRPFQSRFFTVLATNRFSNIHGIAVQSESTELTKMPLSATKGATDGSVELFWPAQFDQSTGETYTIYYSLTEATVDSSYQIGGISGASTAPATMTVAATGLTVGATYYFKVAGEATGLATPISPVYMRSNIIPVYIASTPTPPVITDMTIVEPFTQTDIRADVAWDLHYRTSDGAVKYQLVCSSNTRNVINPASDPFAVQCNYVGDFIKNTNVCTQVVSTEITPSSLSEVTDTGTSRIDADFGRWRYCSIVAYDTHPNPNYTVLSEEGSVLAPVKKPLITNLLYSDAATNSTAQGDWTISSTPAIANYSVYYYTTPLGEGGCTLSGTVFSVACGVFGHSPLTPNATSTRPGTFTNAATDANMFYTIIATSAANIPVHSDEKVLLTVQPTATAGPDSIQINWTEHTPSLSPSYALCIENGTPLAGPIDCNALYNNRATQCDTVVEPFNSGNTLNPPSITIAATHYFYVLATSSRSTGYVCGTSVATRAGVPEKPVITSAKPGYYINAINWNQVTRPPASQGGAMSYVLYRSTQPRSDCDYVALTGCRGYMSYPATTAIQLDDNVSNALTPYTTPATFYYTLVARNDVGDAVSDEVTVTTLSVAATLTTKSLSASQGRATLTTNATNNTYTLFLINQSEPNPLGCVTFLAVTCSATVAASPMLPNRSATFTTSGTSSYVYVRVETPKGEVVYIGPRPVAYESKLTDVAVGTGSGCVITKTNKYVLCWGENNRGQLGNGATSSVFAATAVRVIDESNNPLADVESVGVGWQFACALQSDGDLYCWGDNSRGQVGVGSKVTTNYTRAMQVNTGVRALGNIKVKQIAVGKSSVCVIIDQSEAVPIRCWGWNNVNQLAQNNGGENATRENMQAVTPVFNLSSGVTFVPDSLTMSNDAANNDAGVSFDAEATKTCASGDITLGSTKTRTVFCWGSHANEYGGASGGGGGIASVASLVKGMTGTLPNNTDVTTTLNNDVGVNAESGWPEFIPANLTTTTNNILGNFSTPGTVATASGYSCAIVQNNTQRAVRTWGSASVNSSFLQGGSIIDYAGQFIANAGDSVRCWGKDSDSREAYLGRLGKQIGYNGFSEVGNPENLAIRASASDAFAIKKLGHYASVGSAQTFTIAQPVTRSYPISITCGGKMASTAADQVYISNNINNNRDNVGRCTVSGIGPQSNVRRYHIADVTTSLTGASTQRVYQPRMEVFANFTPIKLSLGYAHACALLALETDVNVKRMSCWGDNSFQQISHFLRPTNEATIQSVSPESRTIVDQRVSTSGGHFYSVIAPYMLRDDTNANQGSVYGVVDASAGNNETCVIPTATDNVYCFGQLYNQRVNSSGPATILINSSLL